MAKKMKKNKKKILMILIILCIIIITITIIILRNLKKQPNNTSNIVIPFSAILFEEEYTGEVSKDDFYKRLYIISEYLPKLSKDIKKQSNLEKYYKKRKDELEEYLGIENLSEFKDIANYLKEHDISETEFAYCSYERASIVKNSYYSDLGMKFVYKNEQELEFKIKLLNRDLKSKPMVKVLVK